MAAVLPSALERHVGYWLRYVSNHVSHAFALKVESAGVSVAEWVVLRELHDEPRVPSVLAERLGITRGAISKIVDRLEGKRLAKRTQSAADRRSQMVSLTAAGKALVPKLAALADRNDEEFFGHLGAEQRDALIASMREIVRRGALKTIPTE